jgi:hypothetical protein
MSRKKTSIDANFSIRLKDLIENKLQIKRTEFIKNVGISQGYLGMVLLGKRGPSAELIAGLFSHYRGYLHWILTGEGETIEFLNKSLPEGIPRVSDPVLPYGPDNHGIGPAVELLANILGSGDQMIIQSLMSGLRALSRAAEKDKLQVSRIQELEEKCKALEERMNAFELKQSADLKSKAA